MKEIGGKHFPKEYILSYKELIYLLDIVNSDLSDKEKARLLYLACSFEKFKGNYDLKDSRKPNVKENLEKLYSYYTDYNKQGLFPMPYYNCPSVDINKNLEILNIIYNGFKSDITDVHKADLFLQYFPNIEAFRKRYLPFVWLGKNDERLNIVKEALANFSTILAQLSELNKNGYFEEFRYYQKYKHYFLNYDYAKFVLNYYLQSPNSFNKKAIYEELGIDEKVFDFCVETVRELDASLYQSYLEKLEKSQIEETMFYQDKINDIVDAIKTGFFSDGTPLDLLEFLKRLPFIENRSFFSTLRSFMRNFNPEKEKIIVDFIHENRLDVDIASLRVSYSFCNNAPSGKPFPPLDLNSVYNRKNIINGYELTTDDIDCIIAYLKVREIPFLIKAYEIAKKDYIDGKFNWDTVRKLQSDVPLKKTLIPTLKK